MVTYLKVGKTIKAITNLTTPFTPWNTFAPWALARRRNACSLLQDRYEVEYKIVLLVLKNLTTNN